jgi:16S rRNA (uracil1498-N3)-methyltransferase
VNRFYIPADAWNSDPLRLDEGESHHCMSVLRMQPGDKLVVFNGRGAEATARIAPESDRHEVKLTLLHQTKAAPLPCRILLGQAVPKGKNMDLIVQKATELGAAAIAPILSERTVARVDGEESAAAKQAKWQGVVIEAAKQCGQNWLPEVPPPRTLKEFFSHLPPVDLMLIASLQPDAGPLRPLLADYSASHGGKRPSSVLILVGPEGDFTPAEIALAKSAGCRPITLGPIVLRTETAAIYCLSVLSYELLGTP